MKGALYNENDPFCAEWLKRLIMADLIAPGDVDERSIEDVSPDDWRGYAQVHAFAGIGAWSLALRMAGWPDERPVWTGSCPCQPFSAAGKGRGFADERHLLPAWLWIVGEHRPDVILGEQVAERDGRLWLDLAACSLESAGYAFGAANLCAAGFGAPHIRQRFFWTALAHANRKPPIGVAVSRSQPFSWSRESCPAFVDDGYPSDMARLLSRAYGNSLVPQVAAAFIEAVMQCLP